MVNVFEYLKNSLHPLEPLEECLKFGLRSFLKLLISKKIKKKKTNYFLGGLKTSGLLLAISSRSWKWTIKVQDIGAINIQRFTAVSIKVISQSEG